MLFGGMNLVQNAQGEWENPDAASYQSSMASNLANASSQGFANVGKQGQGVDPIQLNWSSAGQTQPTFNQTPQFTQQQQPQLTGAPAAAEPFSYWSGSNPDNQVVTNPLTTTPTQRMGLVQDAYGYWNNPNAAQNQTALEATIPGTLPNDNVWMPAEVSDAVDYTGWAPQDAANHQAQMQAVEANKVALQQYPQYQANVAFQPQPELGYSYIEEFKQNNPQILDTLNSLHPGWENLKGTEFDTAIKQASGSWLADTRQVGDESERKQYVSSLMSPGSVGAPGGALDKYYPDWKSKGISEINQMWKDAQTQDRFGNNFNRAALSRSGLNTSGLTQDQLIQALDRFQPQIDELSQLYGDFNQAYDIFNQNRSGEYGIGKAAEAAAKAVPALVDYINYGDTGLVPQQQVMNMLDVLTPYNTTWSGIGEATGFDLLGAMNSAGFNNGSYGGRDFSNISRDQIMNARQSGLKQMAEYLGNQANKSKIDMGELQQYVMSLPSVFSGGRQALIDSWGRVVANAPNVARNEAEFNAAMRQAQQASQQNVSRGGLAQLGSSLNANSWG